ncbi:MAG: hypothetical protein H6742_08930 [Alphaproteobacteria bacterium]|nr:hypothetical protein [Alphaproteobacteria bacterium]
MDEPLAVHWTWFAPPARWNTGGDWQSLTWDEAVQRIAEPELWPGGGSVEYARDQLAGWSFARYHNDSREPTPGEAPVDGGKARVMGVWGLVVEYDDDPTISAEEVLRRWSPWRLLAYTTAHHQVARDDQPEGPRWRVLLPFDHAVTPEEARLVGAWARHPRRRAGVVAAITARPDAWHAGPALAPGGYEQVQRGDGPLLDPSAAARELRSWQEEEKVERARSALKGTGLAELLAAAPAADPLPGSGSGDLDRATGPLWPGMLVAVSCPLAGPRRAVALALCAGALGAGRALLYATTRAPGEEILGRLTALFGGEDWHGLLTGSADRDRVQATLAAIAPGSGLDGVHASLWSVPRDQRDHDALRTRWRVLVEAADVGGMVIVDDPFDLAAGSEETPAAAPDARHTALALRDLAATAVQGHRPVVLAVCPPAQAESLAADLHLQVDLDHSVLVVRSADGTDHQLHLHWQPERGTLRLP